LKTTARSTDTKTPIIKTFKDLQNVVEYLSKYSVKRVKLGDVEIEFDPHLDLLKKNPAATSLEEDPEDKAKSLRDEMKKMLDDQASDELWSV
jgi:hypothetical protein